MTVQAAAMWSPEIGAKHVKEKARISGLDRRADVHGGCIEARSISPFYLALLKEITTPHFLDYFAVLARQHY